jgi:hypothetical protein
MTERKITPELLAGEENQEETQPAQEEAQETQTTTWGGQEDQEEMEHLNGETGNVDAEEDEENEENYEEDITEKNSGINIQEVFDQVIREETSQDDDLSEETKKEIQEQEEMVNKTGITEPAGAINPMRMYDERDRQASLEALQMVYDARNPVHRGILKYQAVDVGDYRGERCLIIYIPDIQSGVEGILPESKAALRKGQELESLMRLPYLRVTPEEIFREEGQCTLNRTLAEKIEAQRTWNEVSEGDDVDAIVLGYKRSPKTRSILYMVLDIGGIVSRMPIYEISHNYVSEKDLKYTRGQTLKVRVIKKEEKTSEIDQKTRRRLKVSLRAREFNPWMQERYIPKIGQQYMGTIIHNSEKWLHIRLATGIEVLAPRPSLNYIGREKLTTVGNNVAIYITRIDRERRFVRGNFSRQEALKEIRIFTRRQLAQQQ